MESISDQEKTLYVETFNPALAHYQGLEEYIPLTIHNIFQQTKDGVLLAALLNHYFPGSVDMSCLKKGLLAENEADKRYIFEVAANLNCVFSALKLRKELVMVNFGPIDVIQGKEELIAGLFWQLVRYDLLSRISITAFPELLVLIREDLSQKCFCKLSKEEVLVKWANYHLEDSAQKITNLVKDAASPNLLATLISRIVPIPHVKDLCHDLLSTADERKPALLSAILEEIGISWSAKDIEEAHPRLVLVAVARLFNKFPGIRLPKAEELELLNNERVELIKMNDSLTGKAHFLEKEMSRMESEFDSTTRNVMHELQEARARISDLELQITRLEQNYLAKLENERNHFIQAAIEHEKELNERFKQERNQVESKLQQKLKGLVSVCGEAGTDGAGKGESGLDALIDTAQALSLTLVQRTKQLSYMNSELKASLEKSEKRNEMIEAKVKQVAECLVNRDAGRRK